MKNSADLGGCYQPRLLIGARKLVFFWHQSEARTAVTVWNWSGKTLSPGALLAVLYFSSFHIYFFARLDFPSPPLSAPGSPRVNPTKMGAEGAERELCNYCPPCFCSVWERKESGIGNAEFATLFLSLFVENHFAFTIFFVSLFF